MEDEHDLSPRPQAQTFFILLARVDAKFIVEIEITRADSVFVADAIYADVIEWTVHGEPACRSPFDGIPTTISVNTPSVAHKPSTTHRAIPLALEITMTCQSTTNRHITNRL